MTFMGQDFSKIPRLEWWLLWGWLILGIGACAILAWKGFEYFVIIMWLYVATKDRVNAFIKEPQVPLIFWLPRWVFGKDVKIWGSFYWPTVGLEDKQRRVGLSFTLPGSDKWIRFWFNLGLTIFTLVLLPLALASFWLYFQQVVFNVSTSAPTILEAANNMVNLGHERLPEFIPQLDLTTVEGLQNFIAQVGGQIVGESIKEAKDLGLSVSGHFISGVSHTLVLWVEATIGAIILSLFYKGGDVMIKVHRAVLEMGIEDKDVRQNVFEFGERLQAMMEQFFVGWMRIAFTLIILLLITLTVLPLKLTLAQVVFLGVFLGFLTSIFKIGGLVATAIGTVLMAFDLQQGFGWWWLPESFVFSTGLLWIDHAIKVPLMFAAVKSKGLMESYYLTPGIIAEQLGIPKAFIILAVIPWALGLKMLGMAIGLNIMFILFCLFQMALERNSEIKERLSLFSPQKH